METIQQAKDYLRENWEDGVSCPCCNQTVKLYKRKLNSSMALGLIMISQKHNGVNTSNWFHLEDYFKDLPVHSTVRGDIPKLRHWGLIEAKQGIKEDGNKHVGLYRITEKGIQFVNNLIDVPEKAKLYNNRFYGTDGKSISIRQALTNKFNYNELMGA